MPTRTHAIVALMLLAGMTLVLPATSAQASPPRSALVLLNDALTASNNAGSMHFVDKTTVNSQVQRLEGAISAPTAGETLTGSDEPLQVELIKGVIYVNGSASAIESALQITAAQAAPAANQWIAVQQSDAPFQILAQTLTLTATLSEFTPETSHLRLGKVQTVGRVKVIPIIGTPSTVQKGTQGSVALLVSTKAPYLPVGGTLILANKTGRLSEVAVFTSWGARVVLPTPTGATPFSTILTD